MAGDGIESFAVQFASSLQFVERAITLPYTVVPSVGVFSYFLRGPPVSLA
jgi:hypothetical protein